jgi:DNA-binding response OmpR family regulator
LLVEDDPTLNELNARALRRAGFNVLIASRLEQARRHLAAAVPDVLILDVMLPDGDGIVFARELRPHLSLPIVFLTSLSDETDEVAALEAGGDDYLRKPFPLSVLVAKVRALVRRDRLRRRLDHGVVAVGDLTLDPTTGRAEVDGLPLDLTRKQSALLAALARRAGRPVGAEELQRAVWGDGAVADRRALWAHVSRLKRALERAGSRLAIRSVRDGGYLLEP